MGFARDAKAAEEVRVAAVEALGAVKPPAGRRVPRRPDRRRPRARASSTPGRRGRRPDPAPASATPRAGCPTLIDGRRLPARPPPRGPADARPAQDGGGRRSSSMARDGKLPDDLKTEATTRPAHPPRPQHPRRGRAGPAAAQDGRGRPLPPIGELIRRDGDADRGREVFFRTGDERAAAAATASRARASGSAPTSRRSAPSTARTSCSARS